ncbi:MAG: peptidase S8, partial [Verrucomicrobia bacterium]
MDAGLVVAVAAGNSGPGPGTIESPGRARKVITVGA